MILVAGHACLDVIPELPAPLPPPGGLLGTGPLAFSPGGVVSNTGLALNRLGLPVRLLARIGDDLLGTCLRQLYTTAGSHLAHHLITVPHQPTSYSVVLSPPGEDRRFLHCPGVNATFTDLDLTPDHLNGCSHLHFGYPTVMPGIYADDGRPLERLLSAARNAGLRTSLDLCHPDAAGRRADWSAIFRRILPHVDVFCPSLDEARVCLQQPDAAPDQLAEQFLAMGCAAVLLKQGDAGVLLRVADPAIASRLPPSWADARLSQPCYRVRVVGTTGSGDTTVAGLLAALTFDLAPRDALRIACGVGACCCEQPDATSGIPSLATVRQRIAQGWDMLGSES